MSISRYSSLRNLGAVALVAGLSPLVAACASPEPREVTAQAEEFAQTLYKHSNLFFNDTSGTITISVDDIEFSTRGRTLASGRIEVGYMNDRSSELIIGDKLYQEEGHTGLDGIPDLIRKNGQDPVRFHNLSDELQREVRLDYNQALSRLNEHIGATVAARVR